MTIKCVRHPDQDALVKSFNGEQWVWLCVDCAAKEGYPLAIQLQSVHLIEKLMEPVQQVEVVQ